MSLNFSTSSSKTMSPKPYRELDLGSKLGLNSFKNPYDQELAEVSTVRGTDRILVETVGSTRTAEADSSQRGKIPFRMEGKQRGRGGGEEKENQNLFPTSFLLPPLDDAHDWLTLTSVPEKNLCEVVRR